ncbi:ATP-binding protein [Candidatus Woesearchaeota archaeon]|nr:ATP-binding protein [Candidatus Woesearchaeota archaeon]
MTQIWYKKLGFYSNPFSIKPAAFQDDIIAYDMSHIYNKIDNAEMLLIEGEYGTGKTTILKNIINRFKGKNKIIYYSFNEAKEFQPHLLIRGANSFIRKVSGLQVKNIVMLLDEVQSMSSSDAKELLPYYKEGVVKSVVFVTHDYDLVRLPKEYETFLNGNVIKTVDLSREEAIGLVRSRIGDLEFLPDKIIHKLFLLSNKNPRRLLAYCEDVLRYAVELGYDTVSEYHVEEVLEEVIQEQKKKESKKKQKAKEAKKDQPVSQEKEKKKSAKKEEKEEEPIKIEIIDISDRPENPAAQPKQPVVKEANGSSKERKYKINKLVENARHDSLGTIAEKEPEMVGQKTESDDDVPEYKVYFLDT